MKNLYLRLMKAPPCARLKMGEVSDCKGLNSNPNGWCNHCAMREAAEVIKNELDEMGDWDS
jgi:hypothetical protein